MRLAAAFRRVIVRVCAQHAGLRISRASEMMSILGGTAATVVRLRLLCLVGGGEGDREHTADRPGKDSRAGCTTFVPGLTIRAIRISDHRWKIN